MENEVLISPREHFICHLLLRKMVIGDAKRRMIFAANALAYVRRPDRAKIRVTSRTFQMLRTELSNAKRGIPRTEEAKINMRLGCKNRVVSKETGRKISESHKRRYQEKPVSAETREKLSKLHKGKKVTAESKLKMSKSQTGHKNGAIEWILKDPIGGVHFIKSLKDFCIMHDLVYGNLKRAKLNYVFEKGTVKGWSVLNKIPLKTSQQYDKTALLIAAQTSVSLKAVLR